MSKLKIIPDGATSSAFPQKISIENSFKETETFYVPGMSKRFFAACMMMNGILKNYSDTAAGSIMYLDTESSVRQAYKYADELLKQESNDMGKDK